MTEKEAKKRAGIIVNNGTEQKFTKTIGKYDTLLLVSKIQILIGIALTASGLIIGKPRFAIGFDIGLCIGWCCFIGIPLQFYKLAIEGLRLLACMIVRSAADSVSYNFDRLDCLRIDCALRILGKDTAISGLSIAGNFLAIDENRLRQMKREVENIGVFVLCPVLPRKYLAKIKVCEEQNDKCNLASFDVESWTGPIKYSALPDAMRAVMEADASCQSEVERILSVYLPPILEANEEAVRGNDESLGKEVLDVANRVAGVLQGIADGNKQNRVLDARATLSAVVKSMEMNGY